MASVTTTYSVGKEPFLGKISIKNIEILFKKQKSYGKILPRDYFIQNFRDVDIIADCVANVAFSLPAAALQSAFLFLVSLYKSTS